MSYASDAPGSQLTVDLPSQTINRPGGGQPIPFDVESFRKHCLLNGLDDIGLTLQKAAKIDAYEARQKELYPWL